MAKITKKNEVFCEEYLIDLNATQAAIRAGYSPNAAGSIGSELLKKPEIRARIDQAMAERSKRTGINADRVLRELGRIAFLNPKEVIDLNTAEVLGTAVEDDLAVIAGVKVKQTPTEFGTSVEREVKMADKLKALGIKFKVVNVADLLSLQSAKENDEALTDEEFADIFTADKPVLFAYHSYAHDVRGLIYDRPNHDNFNVHGYEEEGSTTTPYDMVRVNRIDRYELTAEALRMIDADKYADKIDELEKFRDEAFQFAVDNGYDHPDYTDWVYSGVNTDKKGAVTATAATAGDNE